MSLLPTRHFSHEGKKQQLPTFRVGHNNGVDELFLYHFRHLMEIARYFLVLLFAVVGTGVVFLWILKQGEAADVTLLVEESGIAILFWVSVLAAFFSIYFFQHRHRDLQFLVRHPQKKSPDISWYLQEQSKQALSRAVYIAFEKGAKELESVYLFQSLLFFPAIKNILQRLGIHESDLMARANEKTSSLPAFDRVPEMDIRPLLSTLQKAAALAVSHGAKNITLQDLFLAVMEDTEEVDILFAATGVSIDDVRQQVTMSRIASYVDDSKKKNTFLQRIRPKKMNYSTRAHATPLLDRFSDDMTAQAQLHLLPPCINRVNELTQIIAALENATGNIFLIGARGVGRMGVVQGLANAIAEERVPDIISDNRLLFVRASEIQSHEKPLELMSRMLQEVRASRHVILVFDSFSSLIGRGAGAISLTDLIEPLLTEKNIHIIGLDTPENFQKFIDPQPKLSQHFEAVTIPETDEQLTMSIIASRLPSIEKTHNVTFGFFAIKTLVAITSEYIHTLAQPEKSLDVLEEVASFTIAKHGAGAFVSEQDVREVFHNQTGVQVERSEIDAAEAFPQLEMALKERIVGQEDAIKAVIEAFHFRQGVPKESQHLFARFLFVGPVGVGKTEVARVLARVKFSDDAHFIRLDISEFQGTDGIIRLLGGVDAEGRKIPGRLADAIRRSPASMILLDRIERASKDLLTIFAHILRDGQVASSNGEILDFTESLVIASTAAGAEYIEESVSRKRSFQEIQQALAHDVLLKTFDANFLTLFDAIVPFIPLDVDDLKRIATLQVQEATEHLAEYDIRVEVPDELIQHMIAQVSEPHTNARNIRRIIQGMIADPLAKSLLATPGRRGEVIRFQADGSLKRTAVQ